jgi:predicted MPP superfamily phosphohydrolase
MSIANGARRRVVGAIIAATLLGPPVWAVVEPSRLVRNDHTLALPAWPRGLSGLRVALISDVHAGAPFIDEAKLRSLVAMTNAADPDLVVLLGDYIVGSEIGARHVDPEPIAAALAGLRARLGVFAVLGNHDVWFDGKRVQRAFEASGIRVLVNDAVELRRDGASVWLVGLADIVTGKPRPELVNELPGDAPVLVAEHNPDIFPSLPDRAVLTLAGHTHGGQVRIPLLGRPVVPSRFGQRYAAGHVVEGGSHLFVTTGVGTSNLPIRFGVPPEIAVLTLVTE